MTDTRPVQIKAGHLALKAAVYGRVSTPHQAEVSVGSIAHQRDQREHALRWGWREDQIDSYEADLGLSGSGRVPRPDYERLLRDMANKEIGIVLVSDYSRLSRFPQVSEALLELARITDTLLCIDGTIVDANDPMDRFVARIRSGYAELENEHRATRLRQAKRAKAKEGYAVSRPPVGYVTVRTEKGIHWAKHPSPLVRQRIGDMFHQYEVLGSIRKVLLWLREHHLLVPAKVRDTGEVTWNRASAGGFYTTLVNPAYCGVYRFGLTETWPPGGRGTERPVPREKWIEIPGHHPGYVTPTTWHRIQERLRSNRIQRDSQPAGRGDALCQALVYCGQCGSRLHTRYPAQRGRRKGSTYYVCRLESVGYGGPACLSIAGKVLDPLIAAEVLRALSPPEVETVLAAAGDLNAGHVARERQREEELERVRHRTLILKEHLLQIDPRNRLAAAEVHNDLEEALAALKELERQHRAQPLVPPLELTPERLGEIRQLAADLPGLWADTATTSLDRKTLVRFVVGRVRVLSDLQTGWEVEIVRIDGTATRHALIRPWAWRASAWELAAQGLAPTAIAEELTRRGFLTWQGTPLTERLVRELLNVRKGTPSIANKRRAQKMARQAAMPTGQLSRPVVILARE